MNKYVEKILSQLSELAKRFLPGDFSNRINQAEVWIVEFGVTQNQELWNNIFRLVTSEGVWQGRTRNYISQIASEQKADETISKVKDMNKNLEELRTRTQQFINETLPNYQTATQTVSQQITGNYLIIGVGLLIAFFIVRK